MSESKQTAPDNNPSFPQVSSVRKTSLFEIITTLFFFCSIAVLTFYYFYKVPRAKENFAKMQNVFYNRLDFSGLKMSDQELHSELTDGKPRPLQTLAIRAAYIRWRMKPAYPDCFDQFFNSYEDGLWTIPPKNVWISEFQQLDNNWVRSRAAAKGLHQNVATPGVGRNPAGDILIAFKPGTTSSQLGSLMQAIIAIPSASVQAGTTLVSWTTNQLPHESDYRKRTAQWSLDSHTSGSMLVSELNVDFSTEPFWLLPHMEVNSMRITGPDIPNWKLLSVRFTDSPELKIDTDNDRIPDETPKAGS
jgi:hypothetical protein